MWQNRTCPSKQELQLQLPHHLSPSHGPMKGQWPFQAPWPLKLQLPCCPSVERFELSIPKQLHRRKLGSMRANAKSKPYIYLKNKIFQHKVIYGCIETLWDLDTNVLRSHIVSLLYCVFGRYTGNEQAKLQIKSSPLFKVWVSLLFLQDAQKGPWPACHCSLGRVHGWQEKLRVTFLFLSWKVLVQKCKYCQLVSNAHAKKNIYIHKKIDDKKPYMTIIAISAIRLAHACDGCMHSSINVCCKIWGSNHQCYLKNCSLIWTTRKNGNFNFAGRRCNSQSNITASVLLIESINQPVEK